MSQLILRGHRGAQFKLNVTQFRSTMTSSINTAQTRKMSHHFPIRAGQPDIQFTVQFRSIDDKHAFQNFVRSHQRNSQLADHSPAHLDDSGMVNLFWPQRGIRDWKGYITSLSVQEARFEYAPRMTFGVMLVTSMLSVRTYNNSLGNSFFLSVLADQIDTPYISIEDEPIRPPTPPTTQQQPTDTNTTTDQKNQEQGNGPLSAFFDWAGGIFS